MLHPSLHNRTCRTAHRQRKSRHTLVPCGRRCWCGGSRPRRSCSGRERARALMGPRWGSSIHSKPQGRIDKDRPKPGLRPMLVVCQGGVTPFVVRCASWILGKLTSCCATSLPFATSESHRTVCSSTFLAFATWKACNKERR